MLGRACRILDPLASRKGGEEKSSSPGKFHRLSSQERTCLWRTLLLKVSLLFRTLQQLGKAQILLGKETYDRIFGMSQSQLSNQEPVQFRMVKGEVVGRRLTAGGGKVDLKRAHKDPTMCEHPHHSMKARSNKTAKWWTCVDCLSRWERLPANTLLEMNPEDLGQEMVSFGKHAGSTYQQVKQEDPKYCQWVMQTTEYGEPSPEMRRLAQYLKPVEEIIISDTDSVMDLTNDEDQL